MLLGCYKVIITVCFPGLTYNNHFRVIPQLQINISFSVNSKLHVAAHTGSFIQ